MTKNESTITSHFSAGDSLRSIHQTPGIYRASLKKMQSKPCFYTKSVRLGCAELSFCRIRRKSRDLQFEHGFRTYSFKHKGKKLDVHRFEDEKLKKTKTFDGSCQILVPGALNDTKKICKAGADIFTNFGLEKTLTKPRKSNYSFHFPIVVWIYSETCRIQVQTAGPHINKFPCFSIRFDGQTV